MSLDSEGSAGLGPISGLKPDEYQRFPCATPLGLGIIRIVTQGRPAGGPTLGFVTQPLWG